MYYGAWPAGGAAGTVSQPQDAERDRVNHRRNVGARSDDWAMLEGVDRHAPRRAQLLAPVGEMCARANLVMAAGEFRPRFGPPVLALRCAAEDGSWDAAITVVRARPVPGPAAAPAQRYTRGLAGYDLDHPGEIVYEVQVTEDDDGAGGHGPRPLVIFELAADPQAAADVLKMWVSRATLFRCEIPVADPDARTRTDRRSYEHRKTAATAPKVDLAPVPPPDAGHAADVDPALLCWHFPRDRTGRYQRSAVVALTPCGDGRPHLRGRWLTARADGDRLVLEARDLIPANQRHRWDVTPWLWHRRHARAPALLRWQAGHPVEAAPVFEALRNGRMAEALAQCGVHADAQITRLLTGEPTRLCRARLTATWVASLYAGLAEAAPWRLAGAHQIWKEGREALGLPARHPIPLFGLGGMTQARKPKVALDATADGPLLRLHYTGGSAVLPRSLWTLPADLVPHLYGWPLVGHFEPR
jgi:hypothetical protein